MTADPTPEPAPKSSARKRVAVIVAVVVPLVTAATIIIPIVADTQKTPTTLESLEIEVAGGDVPSAAALATTVDQERDVYRVWYVPLDAPFETVPIGPVAESTYCSEEQWTWLEEWALEPQSLGAMDEDFPKAVEFQNSATDGLPLSITNLHAVGEAGVPDVPALTVYCTPPMGGFDLPQMVKVDFSSSDPAAWGPSSEYDDEPQLEGSVFTMNLAPGETNGVLLEVNWPEAQFRGSLVADVTVGGVTTESTVFDDIFRPYTTTSVTLHFAGPDLYCDSGGDAVAPCSAAEMLAVARR
ncbi:MAG: hypothetical protein H7226_14505 [Salinibacterium sp.]|nr:hypothetical protein [Salinibacterium sp.]